MANLVTNFFDKLIATRVNKAVQAELEKAKKPDDIFFSGLGGSFGLANIRKEKPLEKPTPRGVTFETLRAFANFYPIARACINYRKGQIQQLDWDISIIGESTETGIKTEYTPAQEKAISDLYEMFSYPTGQRSITFRHFLAQIMEDVLIIDALALYRRKNRGGDTIGYLPVDGATIKLKINQDGTTPEPPEVAYEQHVGGKKVADLTTDDMIYRVMNPRTTTPYGMSPLETLIMTVTTALKLQSYNLAYLTEGNVPEGLVELPKEVAASPEQIKKWQDTWDSMMAGDPRALSRMRFLPSGMKYTPTKKPEDMSYERFERWLLQNTCTVFGVQPQDIGFTYETNRATAEVQWEVGKERGLFPFALYIKEIFDEIIQEDFGYDDLEFVWTNINPTNKLDEANVFKTLVDTGAISVDEWRVAEGKEPIGLKHYINTGFGPKFVDNFIKEQELEAGSLSQGLLPGQTTVSGQETQTETPPNENQPKGKEKQNPEETQTGGESGKNVPTVGANKLELAGIADSATNMLELKKWKKVAIHDMERGRPFREFQTSLLDARTKALINDGLRKAASPKDVVELFEPFLSPETRVINAVLDLYDDLGQALAS